MKEYNGSDADLPVLIGRKPCGCRVACVGAGPETDKRILRDRGRTVAEWVSQGWTVETTTKKFMVENLGRCVHKGHPRKNTDGK